MASLKRAAFLLSAFIYAVSSQQAAATTFFLYFTATGTGTYSSPFTPGILPTSATGFINFDLDDAENGMFTYSGVDLIGRTVNASVEVSGDTIGFGAHTEGFLLGPGLDIADLELSVVFEPGYLGSSFPTFFDPQKVLSVSYSGQELADNKITTSSGFLASIHMGQVGGSPDPDPQVFISVFPGALTGVPEPATWAMMLLGFGVCGLAARRRRAKRVTNPYAI
jgi:hypothetical protein